MRNFCLLVVGLACASMASAGMSVKMGVAANNHPYLATVMEGPICGYEVGTTFETFCLEKSENFRSGNIYDVELDMVARNGGGGAVNNEDPLDIRTAWLYANYLDGNLANFTAKNVQKVVWCLEQELSWWNLSWSERNLFDLADDGGDDWGTDFHGVMVMNLSGSDYDPAQSQLIRCLPSQGTIPVPGAALLGMLGLSAIARFRR